MSYIPRFVPCGVAAVLTIGFVLPERFQIMGLAAASAFELANATAREALYDIRLLSEYGGPVRNSLAMSIDTRPLARSKPDTLIVCGLLRPEPSSPVLLRQIRRAAQASRRVAAVC